MSGGYSVNGNWFVAFEEALRAAKKIGPGTQVVRVDDGVVLSEVVHPTAAIEDAY